MGRMDGWMDGRDCVWSKGRNSDISDMNQCGCYPMESIIQREEQVETFPKDPVGMVCFVKQGDIIFMSNADKDMMIVNLKFGPSPADTKNES